MEIPHVSISAEMGITIFIFAGSFWLLIGIALSRFKKGLQALNHFWASDDIATKMSYARFLNTFFLSTLFDESDNEQRIIALYNIKFSGKLIVISFFIFGISQNGGTEIVESFIGSMINTI